MLKFRDGILNGQNNSAWESQLAGIPRKLVIENPDWPWDVIAAKRVALGMSEDMVRASWGSPLHRDDWLLPTQRWFYHNNVLHFKDSILVTREHVISASNLAQAYSWSTTRQGYDDKILLIRGRVEETGREDSRHYIRLKEEEASITGVWCYLAPGFQSGWGMLTERKEVFIRGRCRGEHSRYDNDGNLLKRIVLDQCSILYVRWAL